MKRRVFTIAAVLVAITSIAHAGVQTPAPAQKKAVKKEKKELPELAADKKVARMNLSAHVEVRIADTGPGVPEQDRERVFERFVRLDPARAAGGSGLGLAIARWVAEAHGGDVRIVSTGPGGTVFAASLPS